MDYKDTLNLPKTKFPMKANLVNKEPEMLKKWETEGLYHTIRKLSKGKKRYMLHDGPPYANGNIHMGHALNKILKDIIVKSKQMAGFDVPYVPGWDCHGLPIELMVDKKLGPKKRDMTLVQVRQECREYAKKYIVVQREEFKRLGVFGEWENPYLTMNYNYEAAIVRELGKFAVNGSLIRSKKPVYWCKSCQTALAEAEVEYDDHSTPSIFVKFPMISDISKELPSLYDRKVSVVIWTTTPWTIPANLAIALHPDLPYVAVDIGNDEVIIIAEGLAKTCRDKFDFEIFNILETFSSGKLAGMNTKHPLYDRESVIVLAPYVTLEAGTGCVHTAPGHGREDYETGLNYNLDVYSPVDDKGVFTKDVEFFAGQEVFESNRAVIEKLKEVGSLIMEEKISHEYPHCWRCKKPIIFRATEQWFISMEEGNLRENALEAIKGVSWIPDWGLDRIYAMIKNRPDWCISRQRSWGVPITVFFCKDCGQMVISQEIIDHVAAMVEQSGADVWFAETEERLVPQGTCCPDCGSAKLRKETDILDVWFDSGVSYSAVMEHRDYLDSPSDLYLEGSDQHRGWFHSSLLCSIGTRGIPPYRSVLTHGFVVDGKGKAMHKSVGNVIAPEALIKKYGAEIIRLWVAGEDYRDNIRISEEILQRLTEAYRRIRNTCRYLLGNLDGFDAKKGTVVPYEQMDELDRWALNRLQELNARILRAYDEFEFHQVFHTLHNFCVIDLSSFYLDIIKDRLYVSPPESRARRSAQTVMNEILNVVVRLMAPVLSFTADEIWQFMDDTNKASSVHTCEFIPVKEEFINSELAEKWEEILKVRKEITKVIEVARKDKVIGHSLDVSLILGLSSELEDMLTPYKDQLRSIFIVSSVRILPEAEIDGGSQSEEIKGLKIKVESSIDAKCERCWIYDPTVGQDKSHTTICERCSGALKEMGISQ
ncbi:MAG: isoleucine--tRNA ligase [Deltaproteobacteria bacterium]|nr:isoleucine--tRNA ligase [Deltaproteobacteria bacterium]